MNKTFKAITAKEFDFENHLEHFLRGEDFVGENNVEERNPPGTAAAAANL